MQIAHDDLIQVEYYDVAYASIRRATARADLVPPVISNVAVTNYFGQLIVTWTTDEPADSGVRLGTNLVFTQTRTNGGLVTEHRMVLTDLTTGPVYQFAVASADAAGNRTTNDNGGQWFTFVVAPPALVLLVDDYSSDLLTPDIPVSTYTNALSEAGAGYAVWDVNALGGTPALADLRPYPVVIWRVNDSHRTNDTLGIPQQMAIRQYLDAGGAFFMASMQILSRVGPGPFRSNVLRVGQFTPNPTPAQRCAACDEDAGVPEVGGLANDSRTAGVSLALDYTIYPSKLMFGRDLSDTLAPTSDASAFLHRSDGGKPCAIKFPRPGQDSAGRVVFCAFPLDTIPESGSWPNNRASFLRNVLQFLVPGLDGAGSVAVAQEAYGIASIVVVEMADSDLAGEGEATVTFRSSTAPDPVALALQETTRPGVFRGSVTLVDAANPPAAGQLRAQHGDAIYVDYEDASGPVTIQAIASVDTQPPVISQRTVTPQATEATLRWDTSEPADAVVQFGETPSLGRTVSNIAFALDHELRLPGLTPARVYYYQITSRDRAGNATVEGGPGQPLTFRTVQVLASPFLDNLEQGVTNWSVTGGNNSPVLWTLGPPFNQPGLEAHSPENAWGSNREGVPTDRIDTSLISPAIQLTGGNLATLRFWHRYTFSPLEPGEIDHGQLLLITNFAGPPIMLTQYDDASGDWVEATVNLTPYLGHTINIVWRHEVIGNSVAPHPGWLVDDVAILVTNELRGAVAVAGCEGFLHGGDQIHPGRFGRCPHRFTLTEQA